jgi:hypothetical protein
MSQDVAGYSDIVEVVNSIELADSLVNELQAEDKDRLHYYIESRLVKGG